MGMNTQFDDIIKRNLYKEIEHIQANDEILNKVKVSINGLRREYYGKGKAFSGITMFGINYVKHITAICSTILALFLLFSFVQPIRVFAAEAIEKITDMVYVAMMGENGRYIAVQRPASPVSISWSSGSITDLDDVHLSENVVIHIKAKSELKGGFKLYETAICTRADEEDIGVDKKYSNGDVKLHLLIQRNDSEYNISNIIPELKLDNKKVEKICGRDVFYGEYPLPVYPTKMGKPDMTQKPIEIKTICRWMWEYEDALYSLDDMGMAVPAEVLMDAVTSLIEEQ